MPVQPCPACDRPTAKQLVPASELAEASLPTTRAFVNATRSRGKAPGRMAWAALSGSVLSARFSRCHATLVRFRDRSANSHCATTCSDQSKCEVTPSAPSQPRLGTRRTRSDPRRRCATWSAIGSSIDLPSQRYSAAATNFEGRERTRKSPGWPGCDAPSTRLLAHLNRATRPGLKGRAPLALGRATRSPGRGHEADARARVRD